MTLRRFFVLSLPAALLLAGGVSCDPDRADFLRGTVSELEGARLTLVTEGHPVSFDISEAAVTDAASLLPGCYATVFYEGRIRDRSGRAVRVEVDPLFARLTGRWIETGDDADPAGMGFELYADGKAASIGMQTLIFNSWNLEPDGGLRLRGHIFGPGESVAFDEVWELLDLEADRLTIAQEDLTLFFRREHPEEPSDAPL